MVVSRAASNAEIGQDVAFADGVRALAALSVAVHHAFVYSNSVDGVPGERFWSLGQYGVAVFIAISGFLLCLPIARNGALTGGTWGYLKRRARRILPPYYAALALFTLLILVVPGLNDHTGTAWDSKVPITEWAVASHLLMIHNLTAQAVTIDGPLWSVASEWQIYFFLPLLFLPLWRRLGVWSAVVAGFAVGVVLDRYFPNAHAIFLGVFAAGGAAAYGLVSGAANAGRWGVVSAALLTSGLLLSVVAPSIRTTELWIIEGLVGAGAAGALAYLAAGGVPRVAALLATRSLTTIGLFSYSIYLVHSPLLGWMNLASRDVEIPGFLRFALLASIGVIAAFAFSWAFFWSVERHFLNGHQTRR